MNFSKSRGNCFLFFLFLLMQTSFSLLNIHSFLSSGTVSAIPLHNSLISREIDNRINLNSLSMLSLNQNIKNVIKSPGNVQFGQDVLSHCSDIYPLQEKIECFYNTLEPKRIIERSPKYAIYRNLELENESESYAWKLTYNPSNLNSYSTSSIQIVPNKYLDFGKKYFGEFSVKYISIINVLNEEIEFYGYYPLDPYVPSEFIMRANVDGPANLFDQNIIPPGKRISFPIGFLPNQIGTFTETFILQTSQGSIMYNIMGECIENPYLRQNFTFNNTITVKKGDIWTDTVILDLSKDYSTVVLRGDLKKKSQNVSIIGARWIPHIQEFAGRWLFSDRISAIPPNVNIIKKEENSITFTYDSSNFLDLDVRGRIAISLSNEETIYYPVKLKVENNILIPFPPQFSFESINKVSTSSIFPLYLFNTGNESVVVETVKLPKGFSQLEFKYAHNCFENKNCVLAPQDSIFIGILGCTFDLGFHSSEIEIVTSLENVRIPFRIISLGGKFDFNQEKMYFSAFIPPAVSNQENREFFPEYDVHTIEIESTFSYPIYIFSVFVIPSDDVFGIIESPFPKEIYPNDKFTIKIACVPQLDIESHISHIVFTSMIEGNFIPYSIQLTYISNRPSLYIPKKDELGINAEFEGTMPLSNFGKVRIPSTIRDSIDFGFVSTGDQTTSVRSFFLYNRDPHPVKVKNVYFEDESFREIKIFVQTKDHEPISKKNFNTTSCKSCHQIVKSVLINNRANVLSSIQKLVNKGVEVDNNVEDTNVNVNSLFKKEEDKMNGFVEVTKDLNLILNKYVIKEFRVVVYGKLKTYPRRSNNIIVESEGTRDGAVSSFKFPIHYETCAGTLNSDDRLSFGKVNPGIIVNKPIMMSSSFAQPQQIISAFSSNPNFRVILTNQWLNRNVPTIVGTIEFLPFLNNNDTFLDSEIESKMSQEELIKLYKDGLDTFILTQSMKEKIIKNQKEFKDSLKRYFGTVLLHSSVVANPVEITVSAEVRFQSIVKNVPVGLSVIDDSDDTIEQFFSLSNPNKFPLVVQIFEIEAGNYDEATQGLIPVDSDEDLYFLQKSAQEPIVIPPLTKESFGPIMYNSKSYAKSDGAMIYLRINLTGFEVMEMRFPSSSEYSKLEFFEGSPRRDYTSHELDSQSPLSILLGNSLFSDMCDNIIDSSAEKYSPSTAESFGIIDNRVFHLRNLNHKYPIFIKNIEIDGRSCESTIGTSLFLKECSSFLLQPGESKDIIFGIAPDYKSFKSEHTVSVITGVNNKQEYTVEIWMPSLISECVQFPKLFSFKRVVIVILMLLSTLFAKVYKYVNVARSKPKNQKKKTKKQKPKKLKVKKEKHWDDIMKIFPDEDSSSVSVTASESETPPTLSPRKEGKEERNIQHVDNNDVYKSNIRLHNEHIFESIEEPTNEPITESNGENNGENNVENIVVDAKQVESSGSSDSEPEEVNPDKKDGPKSVQVKDAKKNRKNYNSNIKKKYNRDSNSLPMRGRLRKSPSYRRRDNYNNNNKNYSRSKPGNFKGPRSKSFDSRYKKGQKYDKKNKNKSAPHTPKDLENKPQKKKIWNDDGVSIDQFLNDLTKRKDRAKESENESKYKLPLTPIGQRVDKVDRNAAVENQPWNFFDHDYSFSSANAFSRGSNNNNNNNPWKFNFDDI